MRENADKNNSEYRHFYVMIMSDFPILMVIYVDSFSWLSLSGDAFWYSADLLNISIPQAN